MFYIRKIRLYGLQVKDAIIDLDKGLNIIYGPSNTGKSYISECIDYMLGNDKTRIDLNIGYEWMEFEIESDNGTLIMKRRLDEKKYYVQSTIPYIYTDEYNLSKTSPKFISTVWLKLMGIMEPQKIISSQQMKTQNLTVRTFYHMFYLSEAAVFKEISTLLPFQNTAKTPAKSALLYLISGNTYDDGEVHEDIKIIDAKRDAVIEYLQEQLHEMSEKKKAASSNAHGLSRIEIERQIEQILFDIDNKEGEISIAVQKSKELANSIYQINQKIAECEMLDDRYKVLQNQYAADVKRLTFIVEGELNRQNIPENHICPFCNGELDKEVEESCADAARIEVQKLLPQIRDLEDAQSDIRFEQQNLLDAKEQLTYERTEIEDKINSDLQPDIEALRDRMTHYSRAIELQKESVMLGSFEEEYRIKLRDLEINEPQKILFNIVSHYDKDFISKLEKIIDNILSESKFDNYSGSYFSLGSFDIVVNGKPKESYGKGYRAFLNTVMTFAIQEYLQSFGVYNPSLLVIDSPILSLKEKDDEEASESMKSSLFQYMIDNVTKKQQVIIIENEIPPLNYEKANMIHFTKDVNHGRYGFLDYIE